MKKSIVLIFSILLISCSVNNTEIIKIEKKTTGYIMQGDRLAISPPSLNSKFSNRLHDLMNKIGKAVLSENFVITPRIEINDYNNKKIIILKTARTVGANFVIFSEVEYSTTTYYPERNKFPDHVNLENVDQNQIQFGERMTVSVRLELYNSKNYFQVTERTYNYSFFTMPFEDQKRENKWIREKVDISVREGFKNFLNDTGGKEIKTPRMIFLN
ncbi:MAG: hypothetical protein FXF47_02855 [Candidatus Mcinerneyibacterium aminivorans]|uniref:DUF4136 domain-containing protein n=1 Tax=Candidatus Mcinerneyibacterium aminivorans TaxID=2703815 RepID=A0A5D0MLU5_9BACT|nr:MAG: hypothetical protein FXF47_02855 [Candidatus Mcinerneyibacterium aminivorans]